MTNFFNRIVQAAKLDAHLYEEVKKNPDFLQQSMLVVILVSIASGIGMGAGRMLGGIVAALFGWFLWSYVTYFIGTKLLAEEKTDANFEQLLRAVGFAWSPGLLLILGIFPFLRGLLFLVTQIWAFAAMVVAVRQVLSYQSTGRSVMVCLFGWILYIIVMGLFAVGTT